MDWSSLITLEIIGFSMLKITTSGLEIFYETGTCCNLNAFLMHGSNNSNSCIAIITIAMIIIYIYNWPEVKETNVPLWWVKMKQFVHLGSFVFSWLLFFRHHFLFSKLSIVSVNDVICPIPGVHWDEENMFYDF